MSKLTHANAPTLPLREGRQFAKRSEANFGEGYWRRLLTPPRKMLRIFRPSLKGRVD
jgi:hypothetical protein